MKNMKLDSIILTNLKSKSMNHVIAGITCNSNYYIYNGWYKYDNSKIYINMNIKKIVNILVI